MYKTAAQLQQISRTLKYTTILIMKGIANRPYLFESYIYLLTAFE